MLHIFFWFAKTYGSGEKFRDHFGLGVFMCLEKSVLSLTGQCSKDYVEPIEEYWLKVSLSRLTDAFCQKFQYKCIQQSVLTIHHFEVTVSVLFFPCN